MFFGALSVSVSGRVVAFSYGVVGSVLSWCAAGVVVRPGGGFGSYMVGGTTSFLRDDLLVVLLGRGWCPKFY